MDHGDRSRRTWLFTGAAVVVALGVGFGIAKVTTRSAPADAPKAVIASGPAQIETLAASLNVMGIVVEPVSNSNFSAEILAPATIAPTASGQAVLTAHAAGTITRLTKRLGDPVRAGEVLAYVESREATAIAADRSVADAKLRLARETFEREQRLYDQRVSPKQDVDHARAELAAAEAEARRSNAAAGVARVSADGRSVAVASPISGRITALTVMLGAYVQPETELFRVANPAASEVQASVTAIDAARISAGDPATIVTPSGINLPAHVRSVTPALDPQTRTVTVVLSLDSGMGSVLPGQTLQARIAPKSAGGGAGVVIADEAIQVVEGKEIVFVRTAKGFVVRPVLVGSRSGGRASIVSGLRAGESVATRNAFLLKAELNKAGGDE